MHRIFLALHLIPAHCTLQTPSYQCDFIWILLSFASEKPSPEDWDSDVLLRFVSSTWPPVTATAQAHPVKWEGQAMLDSLSRLQFSLHQTYLKMLTQLPPP